MKHNKEAEKDLIEALHYFFNEIIMQERYAKV